VGYPQPIGELPVEFFNSRTVLHFLADYATCQGL
jgi:hypothetical protein